MACQVMGEGAGITLLPPPPRLLSSPLLAQCPSGPCAVCGCIALGMSSDIDEEEASYYPGSAPGLIHSYVNLVEREGSSEEAKPALPARRERAGGREGNKKENGSRRKSRSRDREKKATTVTDYERVKERERELERIHRRSRELMLGPRSREGSGDRRAGGGRVLDHHMRMTGLAHPQFPHPPPPCHPPPPLSAAPGSLHRYKSSSPGSQAARREARARVQSPNRRDFKDFSHQVLFQGIFSQDKLVWTLFFNLICLLMH